MKRIYLIDCPGVVPPNMGDTEQDILLRGVVRVENVENPEQYIAAVLSKCKKYHVERTYDLRGWNTHIEFLEALARKGGRLLKGGECDLDGCAKMVLNDFLRGKIPWFTPPPGSEDKKDKDGVEGRDGRIGEMAKKRKRATDDVDTETDGGVAVNGDDDFSGFSEGDEEDDDEEEDEDDESEDEKTDGPSEQG